MAGKKHDEYDNQAGLSKKVKEDINRAVRANARQKKVADAQKKRGQK